MSHSHSHGDGGCCDHDHGHGHGNEHGPIPPSQPKPQPPPKDDYRILSEKDKKDGWVDLTKFQDGGLRKKILKKGVEGPKPPKKSKVKCHYVGTLTHTGKKFDSSRDRGEAFEFTIGTGNVIRGWDEGIATMNIGEKCILRCAPDYGYGERGAGADIPPHSWLDFECELLSFDDWDSFDNNRSVDGDDIKKRIIKSLPDDDKENDKSNPQEEAIANVSFIAKYGDNFDKMFASGDNIDIIVDDTDEYPLGFIECIKEMEKGQICEFKILNYDKYGYGKDGNNKLGIPSNSKLFYKITLNSFKNAKSKNDCNSKEKIERALKYKTEGNDAYKKNKLKRAIKQYGKAVDFADDSDIEESESKQAKDIKISCFNNQALVYFKQKEYDLAKTFATKVLEIDDKNKKALIRRGQSKLNSGDWKECKKDFLKVLEIDPNDAIAKNCIKTAKQRMKKYKQEQKALYSSMFGGGGAAKKKKETNKKMDVDESDKKEDKNKEKVVESK